MKELIIAGVFEVVVLCLLLWAIKKIISGSETRMVSAIAKIDTTLKEHDTRHIACRDALDSRFAAKEDTAKEIDKLHNKVTLHGETLAQITERLRGQAI